MLIWVTMFAIAHSAFRCRLIWLLLPLVCAVACNRPVESVAFAAKAGVLDLRGWQPGTEPVVALNGEWEFYWRQLIDPDPLDRLGNRSRGSFAGSDYSGNEREFARLPARWTQSNPELPEHGAASYRLRVLLPEDLDQEVGLGLRFPGIGVCYELYANGRLVARRGRLDERALQSPPRGIENELHPALVILPAVLPGGDRSELELVIHVANRYHGWASGPVDPLRLGDAAVLRAERERAVRVEMFLSGAIAIMGLYHIALYLVRRRDLSPLYFGIFCLCIVMRLLVTGERLLVAAFASTPESTPESIAFFFGLFTRIEYISVFVSGPVFLLFAVALFPRFFFEPRSARQIVRGIVGACALLGVVALFASPLFFARYTMLPFQVLVLVGGLLIFYCVIHAAVACHEGALMFLLGWTVLFLTILNDILGSYRLLNTEFFLPAGLLVFLFAQAALLAIRFTGAFRRIEDLTEELEVQNRALEESAAEQGRQARSFERFVPGAFLELLEKRSVRDVEAGDAKMREMSVLFCDIRGFTTMSEALGPAASFQFLNDYLQRMEPIIKFHAGFVDKYLGDAILALFTDGVNPAGAAQQTTNNSDSTAGATNNENSGDRALGAALAMRERLRELNAERLARSEPELKIGIGITSGEMVLGTLGSQNRLDTTVIGTPVNMASRLESLTAFYDCSILISDFTVKGLRRYADVPMREVGTLLVKGRTEPAGVYEVYAAESLDEIERKERTKSDLFMGVVSFKNRDFTRAIEHFEAVLAVDPEDRIGQVYLQRCEEYRDNPPGDDWLGVFEMYVK